jgi:hypothetical protein
LDKDVKFHIHSQEVEEELNDGAVRIASEWDKIHTSVSAFTCGRNGDHLMIPFECDICIFVKLRKHKPNISNPKDKLLMACIRRMNLDAFWSRTSTTVQGNASRVARQIELSKVVGLNSPFIQKAELPLDDHCGYEVAIQILLASRKPGRYNKAYTQFDTVRHLRSSYSNFIRASNQANQKTISFGDFNGNYSRLVEDECGSFFFKRFMEGLKIRMGQDWRPNMAFTIDLYLRLISEIDDRIEGEESLEEKHKWKVFLIYVLTTYVLSLRGREGLFLDLRGLNKYWNERTDIVKLVLLGKVKGELREREHHLPCVNVTSSGLKIRDRIEDFLQEKRLLGFTSGPAISDHKGKLFSLRELNDMLWEALIKIFEEDVELFPRKIKDQTEIRNYYQCFRSFRRTSDTRALEMGVKKVDIDIVNKWKSDENSRSSKPSLPMHLLYAQFNIFIGPFLRYTKEM